MVIEDIDDIRNGLLTNQHIHTYTANGKLAIIRTPIPGIIKSSDLHVGVADNEPIYTLHYLGINVYDLENQNAIVIPANHRVPIPNPTSSDSPPPFLFDACYGVQCMSAWGPKSTDLNKALKQWSSNTGAGLPIKQGGPDPVDEEQKQQRQDKVDRERKARNERAAKDGADDGILLSYNDDGSLVLPTEAQLDRMDRQELAELFIVLGCLATGPSSWARRHSDRRRENEDRMKNMVENWRKDVSMPV